ncbi:bryoporin-like [Salarias fasciatus]|uniref:Bryoporin-like n=1 Tax=Salarias fasciatus TaxID=181472 RepID=A0A672FKI0_SALFA|nr:bryoporin-like [Salarias fasciatus]XP_029946465.1 bryoporin-like [Salarias fasciatus]
MEIATVAAVAAVGQAVAGALPTHRQCSIQISNHCSSYALCNPRFHQVSGSSSSPFPPTIPAMSSGSGLFIKTPHAACGAVGVCTYDLEHNDTKRREEKLAVMYSVPYDFNLYSNWYAVGVLGARTPCDYDLYCQMYYKASRCFIRGKANGPALAHEGDRFTVLATMSDTYQPVMKVQINQTHK